MISYKTLTITLLLCLLGYSVRGQSLYFEENKGQWPAEIRYQADVTGGQLRITHEGVSVAWIKAEAENFEEIYRPVPLPTIAQAGNLEPLDGLVWNRSWLGSSPDRTFAPSEAISFAKNYFQAESTITDVRMWQSLRVPDLYPGIDLLWHFAENAAKYDLILQPGSDLTSVQMAFEGVDSLSIDPQGNLLIHTAWGDVTEEAPVSWQESPRGKQAVTVRFVMLDNYTVGFEAVSPLNPEATLTIDPVIQTWGTFVHSAASDDYVYAIDRDAQGNLYVCGYTKVASFPITPGVYQQTFAGNVDVWLAKMPATGGAPFYLTLLGGSDYELPFRCKVRTDGSVVLTGYTKSANYPVTAGAWQTSYGGGLTDAFVSIVGSSGNSLIASTFLGGNDQDYAYDLALDANEKPCLAGFTLSPDFPQFELFSQGQSGNGDVCLARLSGNLSSLEVSTLYGGSGYDLANALLVNNQGWWVTGNTNSPDLPITANAFQPSLHTAPGLTVQDAFLIHLNADCDNLSYATYFGGSNLEEGAALAMDTSGAVYLSGNTYSTDLPVAGQPYSVQYRGSSGYGDVFVSKWNAGQAQPAYVTYLGGNNQEYVKAISVNEQGEAILLGATRSPDFPKDNLSAGLHGMYDAFVSVLDATGSGLIHSALFGGNYNDYPRSPGSLVRNDANLSLALTTHSPTASVLGGGYQTSKLNGIADTPWLIGVQIGTVLEPGVEAPFSPEITVTSKVYPNPTAGIFTWESPTGAVSWQLTDALGRPLLMNQLESPATDLQWDLSGQPRGMYWLRLRFAQEADQIFPIVLLQ